MWRVRVSACISLEREKRDEEKAAKGAKRDGVFCWLDGEKIETLIAIHLSSHVWGMELFFSVGQ